jgi:hypothetical protein
VSSESTLFQKYLTDTNWRWCKGTVFAGERVEVVEVYVTSQKSILATVIFWSNFSPIPLRPVVSRTSLDSEKRPPALRRQPLLANPVDIGVELSPSGRRAELD